MRHRLNRGGNRRLNAILYRIALTQARCSTEAPAYLERRRQEGKTRLEAIRALKRSLARALWHLWQECLSQPTGRTSRLATIDIGVSHARRGATGNETAGEAHLEQRRDADANPAGFS